MPLGSPGPRLLLTGFLQLVLAQSEGATRDKSLWIEVYISSTITESSQLIPQLSIICQRSTLAKVKIP